MKYLWILAIFVAVTAEDNLCLQEEMASFKHRFRSTKDQRVFEVNFLNDLTEDNNTVEVNVNSKEFWCQMKELINKLRASSKSQVETVAKDRAKPTPSSVPELIAAEGGRIEMVCSVNGQSDMHLVWKRADLAPMPRSARQQDGVLYLGNLHKSDEGVYVCVGYAGGQQLFSAETRLRVVVPPRIQIMQGRQKNIRPGDDVTLSCLVNGEEPVHLEWVAVHRDMPASATVQGNELQFRGIAKSDAGKYLCRVSNRYGNYEMFADIILDTAETRTAAGDTSLSDVRRAAAGSTVVMNCSSDLQPPVAYMWVKLGGELPANVRHDSALLTLTDLRAQDAGTYVCFAWNNDRGVNASTVLVVTGAVAYFAEASGAYAALSGLGTAAFSVRVTLKPERPDGLILYNGQRPNGTGDFVSLNLNAGRVEFRFGFGSETAAVQVLGPATVEEWLTVGVSWDPRSGTFHLNGPGGEMMDVTGRHSELNLMGPLYLGGVPDFSIISNVTSANGGFVGCISRLEINSTVRDVAREAKSTHGLVICESCPCESGSLCSEVNGHGKSRCIAHKRSAERKRNSLGTVCRAGTCGTGTCVEQEGGLKCQCKLGKGGDRCERDLEISKAAFDGDAFLAFRTPKALRKRRFNLLLKFKPDDIEDGILTYCSNGDGGRGDYMALTIRNKFIEFSIKSGKGLVVIRSKRQLVPGRWVTVVVERNLELSRLTVDDDQPVTTELLGMKKRIKLGTLLYVGGFDRRRVSLARGWGVDAGFRGCVSEVQIGGKNLDIINSAIDARNVKKCRS